MKVTFSTALIFIIAVHVQAHHVSSKDGNYTNPEQRRQMLVKEILNKVSNISLNAFLNTTLEERPQILENIRKKLKMASKLTGSHDNKYIELIMDGIQSFIASESPGVIDYAKKTQSFDSNTQHVHEYGAKPKTTDTENSGLSYELEPADEAVGYRDDICDCNCVERKMCSKIWSLGKFTCFRDQNQISIEKLCDGEYDCNDNSDEEQCALHANKKLLDAKQILKEIENILPKRCLEVQISSDKFVVKTKEKVLASVLKKQVTFLNAFSLIKSEKSMAKLIKEVNEIALVVSSVANALEGALCIRERYKNLFSRRDGTPLDEDLINFIEHKPRSWVPPLCTCVDQFCLQNNCTPVCNTTCWQRYTLGKWVCQAISGVQSVSINLICDGKVDCVDESDEDGCSTGAKADKFEATNMYDNILQVLASKTGSTEFHPQLSKFIKLQEAVRSLQKLSITEPTDVSSIKRWRDEAFSLLLSIYEDTLAKANDFTAVELGYYFLMSVNDNLVEVLKRSKTGNEILVSSNECQCIGDKCLLTECSAACVRTCAVQEIFTEYSCKGDSQVRIPIQNICNGKIECPDGDDEENCKTDICRNQHFLVVLRHNIQHHKAGLANNVLTEILDAWKEKTISTLSLMENNLKNRHDLVYETLHDLVRAYASLPKLTRRSTDLSTAVFLDLASLIQDTLRECT